VPAGFGRMSTRSPRQVRLDALNIHHAAVSRLGIPCARNGPAIRARAKVDISPDFLTLCGCKCCNNIRMLASGVIQLFDARSGSIKFPLGTPFHLTN